ncbi:type IV toxin-antitoxin system AbiEi family antitoxin domain-containing protein [Thermodesulfovibrio hydrogeniphilus]
MKLFELREKLNSKNFFTLRDISQVLNIKENSARVLCTRYVKKGLIIRVKKDFYIFFEKWQSFSNLDFFKIANFLQVPSYISLMTALSFYGITTQVQKGIYESVCLKRTKKYELKDKTLYFYKIKRELYFDFVKYDDFFIATKEKAFIDAVYLSSFGKYSFDLESIDLEKLDAKKIDEIVSKYPVKTQKKLKEICKI